MGSDVPLALVSTMSDPVFVERQTDREDDEQDHNENDWMTRKNSEHMIPPG
jgi:hypothetical protein